MSEQVRRAVTEEILARGPITFDRYMELALYGPGGYYERPPVGPAGDFVTSPHVHPVFAELLATAIRELAVGLGHPEPLRVVEVGAGDGTLATDLLHALGDPPPDYRAVERSEGALAALGERPGIGAVRSMAEVDDPIHVLLAHELCDNLPFRRLRMTPAGAREILVALDGDQLVDVEADLAGSDYPLPAEFTGGLEPGEETVWPVGALSFVDEIGDRLTAAVPGYALLIDYGAAGSPGGPVHGYRDHRVRADLLADPGTTDITAGVDFALLEDRARDRGLRAFPSVTQHRALRALGFEAWMLEALERQASHLDAGEGAQATRLWSDRNLARLLVDPAGLGRLRWLLLASPDLPEPDWLREARSD